MKKTVKEIYEIVRDRSIGFDAIYEDYIEELVGADGLRILKENRLVELCGSMHDRPLYVLIRMRGDILD